jgi:hypothetical protein
MNYRILYCGIALVFAHQWSYAGEHKAQLEKILADHNTEITSARTDIIRLTANASLNTIRVLGILAQQLDTSQQTRALVQGKSEQSIKTVQQEEQGANRIVIASQEMMDLLVIIGKSFAGRNDSALAFLDRLHRDALKRNTATEFPATNVMNAATSCFHLLTFVATSADAQRGKRFAALISTIQQRYRDSNKLAETDFQKAINTVYQTFELMCMFGAILDSRMNDKCYELEQSLMEGNNRSDPQIQLLNGYSRLFEATYLTALALDE